MGGGWGCLWGGGGGGGAGGLLAQGWYVVDGDGTGKAGWGNQKSMNQIKL